MTQDEIIETLGLTYRAEICLKAQDIYTINQLLECTEKRVLNIPNLGPKSLKGIVERLNAHGLKLRGQS
jgi:DNA-directed RNA polymerase alpha subunit